MQSLPCCESHASLNNKDTITSRLFVEIKPCALDSSSLHFCIVSLECCSCSELSLNKRRHDWSRSNWQCVGYIYQLSSLLYFTRDVDVLQAFNREKPGQWAGLLLLSFCEMIGWKRSEWLYHRIIIRILCILKNLRITIDKTFPFLIFVLCGASVGPVTRKEKKLFTKNQLFPSGQDLSQHGLDM